jgi:chromosome segregation ATPase
MSEHDFGHAAGDPLPDRLKQYLTDMARRELDTLRADLEVRLIALETALARPDQHDSIDTLVFDLARAATVEAEAAASRAMLAAQIEAQERSGTADALRDLEAERTASAMLRAELDDQRSRFDADLAQARQEQQEMSARLAALERDLAAAQQDLAARQRDLAAAQRDATEARHLADTRSADLSSARDAAGAAQVEAAARVKTLEAKVRTLEAQAADAERVRREAVSRAETSDVLARETLARVSNAEAWGRDVETRLQAAEARAARDEARVRDADARADLAAKAREALQAERDTLSRERDTLQKERDALQQARDTMQKERDARQNERDALAAEIDALKQAGAREQAHALAREQEQAAGRSAEAQTIAGYEQRLAAADERIRILELQLFQRDRPEPGVADEELSGMLGVSAPAPFKPTRAASRYSFRSGVNVEIDGRLGALVDLSTTGAQVLAADALEEGREAELRLMSDEIPTVCRGRVVWLRIEPRSPRQPLRYRAGILFTQVDVGAVEAFIIRYAAT